MAGVRVIVNGADEARIISKFGRVGKAVSGEVLMRATMAGGKMIEAAAKEAAPIKSGNLRRSITTQPIAQTETKAVVAIGTNMIYAAIHEFGGTITAKNAPYLVFKTDDGTWHAVKSVTMPARPYLRPAADVVGPAAAKAVINIIRALVAAA